MDEKNLIRQAESIKGITTQDQYDVAEAIGKLVSKEIKDVKAYFKPLKADAKKAWDNMVKAEKESLQPLESAKKELGKKMLEFEEEQERIRRMKEEEMAKILPSGVEIDDVMATATYKKAGQTRTITELELTDLGKFLLWLVENEKPDDYVSLKTAKVKELCKSKDAPGVQLVEKKVKVF